MKYLTFLLSLFLLVACGPSPEEIAEQERLAEEARAVELKRKSDLAIVTCNFMKESRNMDAALRIKEINLARERLGEDYYLGTDAGIIESFKYGLCRELVLNDPDYNSKLIVLVAETEEANRKAAEEARIAREKAAEEARIAREKAAEEARIAREKAAEEARIAKEKEAEEPKPLFEVQPIYPRRAKERNMEGYAIIEFTVTELGSVEDPKVIEGKCRPKNTYDAFIDCTMFNSAALRAHTKMKYLPAVKNDKRVAVEKLLKQYNFILEK